MLAVLLGSAVSGMPPFASVGGLAWLGHIVVGWATGDRIRSPAAQAMARPPGHQHGQVALAPRRGVAGGERNRRPDGGPARVDVSRTGPGSAPRSGVTR